MFLLWYLILGTWYFFSAFILSLEFGLKIRYPAVIWEDLNWRNYEYLAGGLARRYILHQRAASGAAKYLLRHNRYGL